MVDDTTIVTIAFFMVLPVFGDSSCKFRSELLVTSVFRFCLQPLNSLAKLARIAISEDSLTESAGQLNQILDYVKQLQAVDLPADVEPFFGAIESVNAIRADENQPSTDPTGLQITVHSTAVFVVPALAGYVSIRIPNQAKPWI